MAKNTTRKSLAVGAAFALATTGLVASPAFANDLSLVPSAGTTYNVFLSDSFTLNSAITGNTNIANTTAWKWEVVNTSGVAVSVSGEWWDTTPNPDAYVDAGLTTSSTGTTKIYAPAAGKVTQTIGQVNKITLNPTTDADTSTFSVTVRSFSDLDSSGSVTAGDLVSPVRTITWHKGSEVTGTVVLDAVNATVTPTATLTFNKDINVEQVTLADITSSFTSNGTAAAGAASALNTAKTGFVLTAAGAATAGQVISATGKWKRYDADATLATASSSTNTVPAASTGTTAKFTLNNSANIATAIAADFGGALPATNAVDSFDNKVLRATAAKSITFTVDITDASSDALGAGAPVTVVVAETAADSIAADTVITSGGKELKSGAAANGVQSVTYYTTTNASGSVSVTVVTDDATAGDKIKVSVTSNTATAELGLVWKAAAIDDVYVTNDLVGDTERTLVKGGSTTINYLLVDQFRQPWTRTNYQYRLTITPSGTATAPSPVVLTNGAGTLNWVDNSTAASGAYNLVAAVQEQTGNGAWQALAAGAEDVTTVINVVSSATAAASISTATALLDDGATAIAATGVPLADKTLAAIDRRVDTNTVAAIGVTANKGAKLVATVTSSTGANVKGASVTVSATGLYFATDAGANTYVSKDSITLNTATNGTVTVYVYSQKAGKQTITFTSGSVTKTQAVTWASAAAADGKTLTVSAPAAAGPGTTFKVTGKLVDKYGNPVKMTNNGAGDPTLSVSYAGPGLVSGSLPTSTNADGEFYVYVLLGANDTGTATLTASYDADGTTATIAAITASSTITVGSVAKVNVGSFNGKLVVYANGHNGKKISWKVGGKWGSAVAASDTAVFSRPTPRKGVTVSVQIYVDGVLTLTKSVVTK